MLRSAKNSPSAALSSAAAVSPVPSLLAAGISGGGGELVPTSPNDVSNAASAAGVPPCCSPCYAFAQRKELLPGREVQRGGVLLASTLASFTSCRHTVRQCEQPVQCRALEQAVGSEAAQ